MAGPFIVYGNDPDEINRVLKDIQNTHSTNVASVSTAVQKVASTLAAAAAVAPSISGVPTSRRVNTATGLIGGGSLASDLTLSIDVTGVTPGVYGSISNIPVLTINAEGQVTNATDRTINFNELIGTCATTQGGTGLVSYALGDTIYASAANTLIQLAGNTTTTKKFYTQTGTGSISAAPSWLALTSSDITGALGFTPINKAGDTGIGALTGISFNAITGLATVVPLINGVAAVGTSTLAARQDHVHPTDTTLQPLSTILTTLSSLANATGWLHNDGAGVLSYSTPPLTTWATLTGIPTILSTLGVLANTAGYLQNDGSGGLSWVAGTGGASWGTITGTAAQAVPSGGFTGTMNAQDAIFRGIIQIGKAGVGGNAAYYNDTGTLNWQQGIMNSPGAVNWSLYDLVNARSIITADASTGAVTLFGALSAGVITGTSFNAITGLATIAPLINGTAAVGTSTLAARQDHVHPTDTSRQAALSGTGFVKISGTTISYDNSTYYLASNPSGYTTNLGTVTSVAALTLGTTGTDLSSTVATGTTTPVITLNVPTASASNRGALSAADWSTFNGKQAALGFTPINKAGDSGIGSLISTGTVTASLFSGSGASLTNLQWGQLVGSSPQASPAGGWSNGATFGGTISAPTLNSSIINLSRNTTPATGINWYSPTYNAWQQYMGPPGSGQGFGGNITAPSGQYVTGWALRSFVEPNAGYGWTWESGLNASTSPLIVAELSSNTGNFKTIGAVSAVLFNATATGTNVINATLTTGVSDANFRLIAANGSGSTANSEHAWLGMAYAGSRLAGISFIRGSSANADMQFTTNNNTIALTLGFDQTATFASSVTATTLSTSAPLVSGLPTGAAGMHSFVTDALAPTFGATVVGGGAVGVPVYHDGVSWKVG